jgi:hypothetical protein
MSDDKLTPVQRSVLLILMAEAREVPNADLTNERKLELKKDRRDKLEQLKLIKVRHKGARLFLELDDGGWRWCREQLGAEVPANAGHGGAAAYAILASIQRYLDRNNLSIQEFFAQTAEKEPASEPQITSSSISSADVEARIRKAYGELAPRPGAWVKLADLRPLVSRVDRAEVDRILVQMNRAPDVSIVPESNQKTLTSRDRDAAVSIGDQDKHLIKIGS